MDELKDKNCIRYMRDAPHKRVFKCADKVVVVCDTIVIVGDTYIKKSNISYVSHSHNDQYNIYVTGTEISVASVRCSPQDGTELMLSIMGCPEKKEEPVIDLFA